MEIRILTDPNTLAAAAADLFQTCAAAAIQQKGFFAVALSGGASPKLMHRQLIERPLDWARIQVFWGDERCVPPAHPDSSYCMARETLLDHVAIPAENVHRLPGEIEPALAAAQYETELRAQLVAPPAWDLVFLGLGEDGHTASIFPGSSALQETHRWIVAQEHRIPPEPLVDRLTATPAFLNQAAHIVFLVTGANKASRVREVLRGPGQPTPLPAQSIRPTNGKLIWLLDAAAAGQLGSDTNQTQ